MFLLLQPCLHYGNVSSLNVLQFVWEAWEDDSCTWEWILSPALTCWGCKFLLNIPSKQVSKDLYACHRLISISTSTAVWKYAWLSPPFPHSPPLPTRVDPNEECHHPLNPHVSLPQKLHQNLTVCFLLQPPWVMDTDHRVRAGASWGTDKDCAKAYPSLLLTECPWTILCLSFSLWWVPMSLSFFGPSYTQIHNYLPFHFFSSKTEY